MVFGRHKWKSEDPYRRESAIKELTDQKVLVDIAKNDKEAWVRCSAVDKLTDQVILTEIAKSDKDSRPRQHAVRKLFDQSVLAEIAKNDENWEVRDAAVSRLTNTQNLIDVANNSKSCKAIFGNDEKDRVRFIAADKLIDQTFVQNVFLEIAKNKANYESLREDAIKKLTDKDMLNSIVNGEKDDYYYEYEVDYTYYGYSKKTSDLREKARERLAELYRE